MIAKLDVGWKPLILLVVKFVEFFLPNTIRLSVGPSGIIFEKPHADVESSEHKNSDITVYCNIKFVDELSHLKGVEFAWRNMHNVHETLD